MTATEIITPGMPEPTPNPYVGPRAFGFAERERFFGREREARELLSLVISERLVLFYAQSGAGKTSLIHTRLIPGLREQAGFAVLPAGRVSGPVPEDGGKIANLFVYNLLQQLAPSSDTGRYAGMTLSRFLDRLSSDDGQHYRLDPDPPAPSIDPEPDSDGPIHCLIIDQFEELLTSHPERWRERRDFFVQLEQAMRDDPRLWVVLSLREDHVAALDPYARILSGRMRARYYMQRMGPEAALQAIGRPAAAHGRPFAPGVAETLVENLRQVQVSGAEQTHAGPFIEPVQLQVVCFQLWQRLAERPPAPIQAADLAAAGNVDDALADFYEQVLAEITQSFPEVPQSTLRDWLDHRLITEAGTRGTVFMGPEQTATLPNALVLALADRFLLRAETRAGGAWYELVHDRFIEPIRRANRAWLERQDPLLRDARAWDATGRGDASLLYQGEMLSKALAAGAALRALPVCDAFLAAAEQAQAERAEREAARQRELAANRKFRRLFWGMTLVTILTIAVTLWAGWQTRIARDQTRQADHRLGLVFNEKAVAALAEHNPTRAHLYYLHALNNLDPQSDPAAFSDAVLGALRPLPARSIYRSPAPHHGSSVTAVAWSPSGETLASASRDGRLRLWDARDGHLRATLGPHGNQVMSVAWSPDGKTLAAGTVDNTLCLWDVPSGTLRATLFGHAHWVMTVAWSPDSKVLASGSLDETVRLWRAADGAPLMTLEGHDSGVLGLAWSPDGKTLASGSYDETIRLWDTTTGQLRTTLEGHQGGVEALAWSPDGNTLASGSGYRTIRLWDVSIGHTMAAFEITEGRIHSIVWSPDGRSLASGSSDGLVRIWDAAGDQLAASGAQPRATLKGHRSGVKSVAWSPDGKTLASGSHEGVIRLWDTSSAKALAAVEGQAGQVLEVAWSPDGRMLAIGSHDGTVQLWDAVKGRSRAMLEGHEGGAYSVDWSPDGHTLATGSWYGSVRIWDVAAGEVRATMEEPGDSTVRVRFAPDGKTLAAASDRSLRIWNPDTGGLLSTLEEGESIMGPLAWSTNGKALAWGGRDGRVRLWSAATGGPIATLAKKVAGISSLAWRPDGQTLAIGSSDGVRELRVGDEILGLGRDQVSRPTSPSLGNRTSGGNAGVSSIAWSPDGKLLATGGRDGRVHLRRAIDGPPLAILEGHRGHRGSVETLAWSPDGRTLASGSRDGTWRLWGLSDELRELRESERWTERVAWSPDGNLLASISITNQVSLWDPISGRLRARTWEVSSSDDVSDLAWSPDSRTLAVGTKKGELRVLDAVAGSVRATLRGHGGLGGLAWSADGRILRDTTSDGKLRRWSVRDAVGNFAADGPGTTLLQPGDMGRELAWSPDGLSVISVSPDRQDLELRLHDAASGRVLSRLRSTGAPFNVFEWSPDATMLAAGLIDGEMLIWDLSPGQQASSRPSPRLTLPGQGSWSRRVTSLAWSPGGGVLASATGDGSVRLWETLTGRPLGMAEPKVGVVKSMSWSPDGTALAMGWGDVRIWDVARTLAMGARLSTGDRAFIQSSLAAFPCVLEGIELSLREPPSLWISEPPAPAWAESHPFHWLQAAEAGDRDAMAALGLIYHRANDYDRALEWYERAIAAGAGDKVRLRARDLRRQQQREIETRVRAAVHDGRIDAAIELVDEARQLKTALPLALSTANVICWRGALADRAGVVLPYCDQGVKAFPHAVNLRDSRGIARALVGDLAGALEDLRYFLEHADDWDAEIIERRRAWLAELEAGRNPIDKAELKALRNE